MIPSRLLKLAAPFLLACGLSAPALAQFGPAGPPAVGVVAAALQPITESSEFVGRVQATDHVDLVARVTGWLLERRFTEGAEVKQGDLLYRLERGPFEADVAAKQAAIAQNTALLANAELTLQRARALINTPAGQQSTLDDALSQERSLMAQVQGGRAQLAQSEINLGYTDITAPIAGKIGRSAVTPGNLVSPTSGVLASIVSQDPMYVTFPVSTRTFQDLRAHYAGKGGLTAVVLRLRLPDGKLYGQTGKVNFVDNSIAASTDTILLRGGIANPAAANGERPLIDGEFVSVLVEGIEPIQALAIPRAAVLSDQQGDYVFVVGAGNKVEQRRIQLGQSTATTAIVSTGLKPGEQVIVDGVQRARPGIEVSPGPASPGPSAAGATGH